MKVVKRILKGCAILFGCWLLLRLIFDPWLITYVRFRLHGQQYYANVAAACDKLIADAHGEDKKLRRAEMPSLPAILQDVKPEGADVRTNAVILFNGGTWSGIVLYWVANHEDPTLWHLAIRDGENGAHDVFTKRK